MERVVVAVEAVEEGGFEGGGGGVGEGGRGVCGGREVDGFGTCVGVLVMFVACFRRR